MLHSVEQPEGMQEMPRVTPVLQNLAMLCSENEAPIKKHGNTLQKL